MALIDCKECGEKVSTKAKSCPKCGNTKLKKTSKLALLTIIIVGSYIVWGITQIDNTPKTANYSKKFESTSYSNEPVIPKWDYYSFEDKMTGNKTYQASMKSINGLNFGFPYQGSQKATLTLRTHPRYGKDLILRIER